MTTTDSLLAGIAGAAVVFAASAAAASTVYDLNSNSILNTFTPYSYGYLATLSGSFTAFDDTASGPSCCDEQSATGIATLGVYQDQIDGGIFLQPGPSGQYAVIRFTAPTAGSYGIAATFSAYRNVATTSDVHVYVDGVSALDGTVGSPTVFDATRALSVNDTVDFVVGPGTDGSYLNDSTGFTSVLTLAGTPEPAAWTLMAIGFGLAGYVLRRRRAALGVA